MREIEKLNEVLAYIKSSFVGKNEIIDVLGIALVARENAFLLGPPGTAKSAIVRALSDGIKGGSNFEYLLTRFTEPNEIFGPFDIRKLREGELVTNTEGMMPEASMIFLDEIFNANSAILNSLLMALNEKIFRRGKETKMLPALMFIGASNTLPEDETLNALLDRFLIRAECENVAPDRLNEVLLAGWNFGNDMAKDRPVISADEVILLQKECRKVDLAGIRKPYVELIHNLRNTGIKVSDRRAVKIQNLIAASALMCNRKEAVLSDLWVVKYVWDTEEQIEILAAIIDALLEKDDSPVSHPLAKYNQAPNAEELLKEVNMLRGQWESQSLSFEEQSMIKDKLRYVQTRSHWIKKPEHQHQIQTEIESLWQAILQAV